MDFDEPYDRPESATIEHLIDATLGGVRKQQHRRLAHAICNRMRNEFRMQAERQFQAWIAARVPAPPAADLQTPAADPSSPT